jgi:hypothetical protein
MAVIAKRSNPAYRSSGHFWIALLTNIDDLSAEIFSGSTSYATFSQVSDTDHLRPLPQGPTSQPAISAEDRRLGHRQRLPGRLLQRRSRHRAGSGTQTWGMLLAGVGLIGLRMRQRHRASQQAAIG